MSEPVETEGYLISVLRYIHQNPVKAKIVKQSKEYLWSSYSLYISAYEDQNSQIDAQLIKGYLKTKEDFERYMNEQSDDDFMDNKSVRKYTDEALREILQEQIDFNKLVLLPVQELVLSSVEFQ
jgi:putative transposase